jgi:DNA repair protein RecN (Recombination protein N)
MLLELRAENYAVIDRSVVVFGPGLNLMTGETGAGKSILIDALSLLLGGKASADLIRHGAEKATVSCVFESTAAAAAVLDANGIDAAEETDQILLRREILGGGKGRVFINQQPATVAVLRQLAPELALVHTQSETLQAFDQAQQRSLLERFGGISTAATAEAFAAWRATADRLDSLRTGEQDRMRMADLWRFQAKEIAEAGLDDVEEDAQLEAERRVLSNAERLQTAALSAYDLLYESEHAAESSLGSAGRLLDELARYDARFVEAAQQIATARVAVEDVSSTLSRFAETVTAAPERLTQIGDRLAALDRLKRKYGASLAEVIAFGADAAQKLAEIDNRDERLAELERQLQNDAEAYRGAARRLSAERAAAALELQKLATAQINSLAMKVQFAVAVTPHDEPDSWSAHGFDRIACSIATGAGEPLKPLEEIASGGEMSRILLALKVTIEERVAARGAHGSRTGKAAKRAAAVAPRTLIFDEIDIGIGGRAAEAVGRKLKTLARSQQVLCITHLPQIAAFADHHLLIEKTEDRGRMHTHVRQLTAEERTTEVARMLSGERITETSIDHARSMIAANAQ